MTKPDLRDFATRAVDRLIQQDLLNPFQRYNIGQVIREEKEQEQQSKHSLPLSLPTIFLESLAVLFMNN